MTKLLDHALEAAHSLDEFKPVGLLLEERLVITVSKAAAARGEFATDEQVRATWAKHGL
jgi:hypothetical protein